MNSDEKRNIITKDTFALVMERKKYMEKESSKKGKTEKLTREKKKEQQIQQMKLLMEKNGGVVKTSQLYELGMDYRRIQHFVDYGVIERVKNGYYAMDYRKKDEEAIILRLFSDCVLTMESALYYYRYLKHKPFQWTIAVDKNTSKSRFYNFLSYVFNNFCIGLT